MRSKSRLALPALLLSVAGLVACANPQAQVSVPIGPWGRVGVSVGSGGVTGHVGVGGKVGGVSVGGGADVPISGQ